MAKSNYSAVMAEIFKHEGGYVDHPRDPGGATNMGITFSVLQEWRGEAITKDDVKRLTKKEAEDIYRVKYWNVVRGDDLPVGIDLVMMDGSVNSGVGRGPKWVQKALGVAQDGKVGPETIRHAKQANAAVVINGACDARMSFLKSLKTWDTFGKGWTRRVDEVRKRALEMAKAPAYVDPIPEPPDAPIIVDTLPQPKKASGMGAIMLIAAIIGVLAIVFGPRLFGG